MNEWVENRTLTEIEKTGGTAVGRCGVGVHQRIQREDRRELSHDLCSGVK